MKQTIFAAIEIESDFELDLFSDGSDAATWMDMHLGDPVRKVDTTVYLNHPLALAADYINVQLMHEGWALFDYDSLGLFEIERDDDKDVFDSDDEAVAHVERMAESGSALHAWALVLHRGFAPMIDKEINPEK